jgi:hypothetical protein
MSQRKDFMPMAKALFTRAALVGRIPPGVTPEGFERIDKQDRSRAERRREYKQLREDVTGMRKKEKREKAKSAAELRKAWKPGRADKR